MSAAAERAANYAFWQLWVGVLGLAFIAGSLWIAAKAAYAARDAALAAIEQGRIMRNADRPYLIPRDPELRNFPNTRTGDICGSDLQVRFGLGNLGKGVAFFDSYVIAVDICPEGQEGKKDMSTPQPMDRLPITGGSIWNTEAAFYFFDLSENQMSAVVAGLKTIFIYGAIRYSDIYGIFRHSCFMFGYAPNVWDAEKGILYIHRSDVWWRDVEEERPTCKGGEHEEQRAEHPALLPTWPPPSKSGSG